jgi:hypothetical protein
MERTVPCGRHMAPTGVDGAPTAGRRLAAGRLALIEDIAEGVREVEGQVLEVQARMVMTLDDIRLRSAVSIAEGCSHGVLLLPSLEDGDGRVEKLAEPSEARLFA